MVAALRVSPKRKKPSRNDRLGLVVVYGGMDTAAYCHNSNDISPEPFGVGKRVVRKFREEAGEIFSTGSMTSLSSFRQATSFTSLILIRTRSIY